MSSIKGRRVVFSMFGESHGPAIGMTINGLGEGVFIDDDAVQIALNKRRTGGSFASQRHEEDTVEWLSGRLGNYTTGAPLTFVIRNMNQRPKDYDTMGYLVRPSHSDYPAFVKYKGMNDKRGGGMFSGRLTAALVVTGTLCKTLLDSKNITIHASLTKLGSISLPVEATLQSEKSWLDSLENKWRSLVNDVLSNVQQQGDSIGGVLKVRVEGMPVGVGEAHFHSIESELSSWLFSIPGLKGIQFGLGFDFSTMTGSQVNDSAFISEGEIKHRSNHNGGVFGGMTNGMPLEFDVVFKPTPSIYIPQKTIDMETLTEQELSITGRHDPAYVIRTPIIVECVTAIALLDLMRSAQL
jgi:chorismate synthase